MSKPNKTDKKENVFYKYNLKKIYICMHRKKK